MTTAKFIKKIEGWRGDARLYELSEAIPFDGGTTKFIIVSAAIAPFTGPETYIFPAHANGDEISFEELDGSYRGGLSHEAALEGAGLQIEERIT